MKRVRKILFLLSVIFLMGFISAGNYNAGTYNKGLYGIGEAVIIPPVTPSGGGGGGGPTCSYDWVCTDWFPSECPASEIQERLCINKGTCNGVSEMPNQTRTCVYEHKEPLFDIFLTIPELYKKICSGNEVKANISLQNYGRIELLDAFMTYWIVDSENHLISEVKDTRNVADEINFEISMKVPKEVLSGNYRLYAQIVYSGNKTAIAGESFNVIEKDSCKPLFDWMAYLPLILIGFGFFVTFILILIILRKITSLIKKIKNVIKSKK